MGKAIADKIQVKFHQVVRAFTGNKAEEVQAALPAGSGLKATGHRIRDKEHFSTD